MITPILAPLLDNTSLVSACEKALQTNPYEGSQKRKYPDEEFRSILNALRLDYTYDPSDLSVRDLFHIGYLIVATDNILLSVGRFTQSHIVSGVGVFVGSLVEWQKCIVSLLREEISEDIRDEVFQIYNHLNFLKLGFLFSEYRLKGKVLTK